MDRKKIIQVVITVAAVFACGIVYLVSGNTGNSAKDVTESLSSDERASDTSDSYVVSGGALGSQTVYVYVCGAVKNPDVYTFDREPRAIEAVEAAGGFTKKADQSAVNLALKLYDGAQLVIPEKGKSTNSGTVSASTSDSSASDGRVNINTADKTELITIPGIGDAKASSIISYRDEHGAFAKPEDIKNIPGIKDGVYNRIKDYITV